MSRKSVQISIPAPGVAPTAPARMSAGKTIGIDKLGIDSWVAQADDAMDAIREETFATHSGQERGLSVTVRLSTEPNLSDAMKIFFFLPQAALWYWSLGAARRFMRGPYNWMP